ncbi:MAG: hypothetical protein ABL995_03850 [Bryobacteraceae bacterium]
MDVRTDSTFTTIRTFVLAAGIAALTGCSSQAPETPKQKQAGAPQAISSVISSKHPVAKYLELAGFRLSESGAGKLTVKFAVINHSNADVGDLDLHIKLLTTAAAAGDPPITEFDAKVAGLGPLETKDASGTAITKLRVYEMPDWQFIKADAEITSPAP